MQFSEKNRHQSMVFFHILFSMKSLFEYIDYRKFLADYYSHKKATTRSFSYRYFALKAQIHSPSFMKEVIDGKRNLTRKMTKHFCTALCLNDKESVYFRNLVLFDQAKTSIKKQEHYSNLRAMFGSVSESVLQTDQFDYFAHWYTPVIRELICQYDFQDDFKTIAAMCIPAILPSEVKSAVRLLLRLKLIHRNKNGIYRQSNTAIVANNSIMSIAMRTFAMTMLEHSKEAIEHIHWKIRHISSLTIGISPVTYDVLSAEIDAFKDRIKTIVNRDRDNNQVYEMNVSLFPVSRNVSELQVRRYITHYTD